MATSAMPRAVSVRGRRLAVRETFMFSRAVSVCVMVMPVLAIVMRV